MFDVFGNSKGRIRYFFQVILSNIELIRRSQKVWDPPKIWPDCAYEEFWHFCTLVIISCSQCIFFSIECFCLSWIKLLDEDPFLVSSSPSFRYSRIATHTQVSSFKDNILFFISVLKVYIKLHGKWLSSLYSFGLTCSLLQWNNILGNFLLFTADLKLPQATLL